MDIMTPALEAYIAARDKELRESVKAALLLARAFAPGYSLVLKKSVIISPLEGVEVKEVVEKLNGGARSPPLPGKVAL